MIKILLIITVCQVLQTSYTLRRLHNEHAGLRYWLELTPLIIATAILVFLMARLLELLPHVVI